MGGHYSSAPFPAGNPALPNGAEGGMRETDAKAQPNESERVGADGKEIYEADRPNRLKGMLMGASPHLPGRRVFSVGWHPLWVYSLYDTKTLAQRAKRMFDELIIKASPATSSSSEPSLAAASNDPVSYSFWLAANLPLDDVVRQELLEST